MLALLNEPLPESAELPDYLRALEQEPAPLADWPDFDSPLGQHFRVACTVAFLKPHGAGTWLAALRRLLGPQRFEQLMLLLAFIRTAHFWTQVHPELTFEPDLEQLLQEQQELAEPLLHQTDEAARFELGEHLHAELQELRGAVEDAERLRIEITERKRAEEALPASEARFRGLIENSCDAVALFAADGKILYSSPSQMRMLSYAPENLLGRNALEFTHPEDHELVKQQLAESLQKPGVGVPTHARVRRADGSWRHLEGFFTNLLHEPGVNAIVNNYRDVTDRKQAEEERRLLEAQIQHAQKLESLGLLAGGIAHDFNNLLTSILGYSDLALLALPADSLPRNFIEEVVKGARRAAELTQQMLAYSGKGRFVVQPLVLSTLVEDTSRLLEVSISKKCVLKYNFTPNLPTVEADASQLRQIVMNLVINASEAIGDRSGVVAITTGAMHCDRAYLTETYLDESLPEGLYVYLEVADTGCGMSEETRAKIFDPFFTTKFTGRGLGLAAVLGVVRGHRGALKVYSELGKGTTFKVLFPASTQPVLTEPVTGTGAEAWRGSGTVLVVDDEEEVRGLARFMLAAMGFDVLTAADGREGVALFRTEAERIRLVLLDMTMPHLDGAETFRELRRIRGDVRALLSSGYNEQAATNTFAGKGLAGFIQKPYGFKELQAAVRKVLES